MVDNSEFILGVKKVTEQIIQIGVMRMHSAVELVKTAAVEEAPSDTGILRASMVTDVERKSDEIVGMVGNTSEYAPYVHQGTGIYAKDGNGRKTPWSYFVASGRYKGWHRTKGQKPNPFLQRAREKSMDGIKTILGVK